ncbi:MAG: PadR family transcriptional regulator [Capsulimonadales bacterium]|nr:PadR family transcriptional regulator [Capsulimonadales bacterium]
MSDRSVLRSNPTTLILIILRDGASHGYDIAREVGRRSDGAFSLPYGTLYTYLRALEKEGLVQSVWERPPGELERRVYQLTDRGTEAAEAALNSWTSFAEAMDKVIRRRRPQERSA